MLIKGEQVDFCTSKVQKYGEVQQPACPLLRLIQAYRAIMTFQRLKNMDGFQKKSLEFRKE